MGVSLKSLKRHHPCLTMSDEEYAEEESVSNTSKKGDGTFRKARGEAKKVELDEQLKEYINEWRKQRQKEEEELAQQKKEEEERLRKEEAEKKAAEAEEKRKSRCIIRNIPLYNIKTCKTSKLINPF